jgi:hypothetical protein
VVDALNQWTYDNDWFVWIAIPVLAVATFLLIYTWPRR